VLHDCDLLPISFILALYLFPTKLSAPFFLSLSLSLPPTLHPPIRQVGTACPLFISLWAVFRAYRLRRRELRRLRRKKTDSPSVPSSSVLRQRKMGLPPTAAPTAPRRLAPPLFHPLPQRMRLAHSEHVVDKA